MMLVWASGCGINMVQHYGAIRPALAAHDSAYALKIIEHDKEHFYGDKNELLYLMDKAMVLFDAGDTAGCQATLEAAKLLTQKLWTRSIGAEAEAWLSTDNALPYQGEDFEKVFLHLLAALSYLQRQALDDARVEARQVSAKLALLVRSQADSPSLYRDDAFAHWLSGLLYEAEASNLARLSDARIEYARALALYEGVDGPHYGTPVPRHLLRALARTYAALGTEARAELTSLRRRYGAQATATPDPDDATTARLVVVVLAGEAPIKAQEVWESVLGPNLYRVAYPVFLRRPQSYAPPQVVVESQGVGVAQAPVQELAMDVEAVALRNLHDHMDRIKDRVMRRAVLKYTAGTVAEGVGLSQGGLVGFSTFVAGLALNTVTAATEEADTRSWTTLPARIYVSEMRVPLGPVRVRVGTNPPVTLVARPAQTLFVAARQLF